RLRVLHPLSYVEDPTRLFRAARYATRFGLAPDAATARAQTLALRLAPYAALSGQRIVAELERILVEPHAAETLARLGRGGAFRLLDPRYRFTAATGRLVTELPGTLAWARQRGLGAEPVELGALALTADQPSAVASPARASDTPSARGGRAWRGSPRRARRAPVRACSASSLPWRWPGSGSWATATRAPRSIGTSGSTARPSPCPGTRSSRSASRAGRQSRVSSPSCGTGGWTVASRTVRRRSNRSGDC